MSFGFSIWDLNVWFGIPGIPTIHIKNIPWYNSREVGRNIKLEDCDWFDWSPINDIIGRKIYDKYAKITSKEYDSLYIMNRTSGINVHAEVVEKVYEKFYGKSFKELWK